MSEGMPGFMKTLKIVGFINDLELTEEEIEEAVDHFRRADNTHGLLWGDIANLGRENKALKLLSLLSMIMRDIQKWRIDEAYATAVVAAHLQATQEAIA